MDKEECKSCIVFCDDKCIIMSKYFNSKGDAISQTQFEEESPMNETTGSTQSKIKES